MRPRGSSGDGEVPETESVKHRNLSELPLEELERLLASPSFTLTFPAAVQVRDRSAALVATDPSLAYRLSSALMDALARSPHGADGRTKAVAWRCRAEACAYTGRSKDAREAYESASSEARAAGDRGLLGQILVGRFGLISMMGASAEATRLAKEAERLLREEGDHLYLGKLYMNLGNAFYHQERYADASKAYGRSAATLERAGQRDATWIGLLINQAVACTQLSQIGEARKLFLKTEASCDELGFDHLKAQAQFNRAFLEQVRGDFREALSLLEESGQTFEQNDEIAMVAASERARAEVYFELGMPREALELARSAAEAFSREEMVIDEMLSHMDEARALLSLDRLSEASETLEKVGSLFEARRNRSSRAIALLLLARVQIELGHLRQARASVLEALRTFDSMGMSQRASEGRRLLATTFLAESKPAKAEDALQPAMHQKRRLPLGERLELWALAGRISMFRNRRPEAASRLRRALRHVDAQRRLIPGVEFRARAFERHVSIYHDLINLTLSSRRPGFDRLFSLVGAARARGFRERLGAKERRAHGGTLEKRAQLGSLIRKVEEAEHSDGAEAEKLHDWQAEIRRLEGELERDFQREQAKESGASGWVSSRDGKEVAGRLRRDEALVEYFVTGEAILAFVLTRDRQTFLTLPATAHSVHECLERIHFQLETMAMTADRPVGSEAFLQGAADELLMSLHSMLVEPLSDRLPPSGRLLLIPHGFLHQVPFECLRDGSRYMDERWEIARIPTTDFLKRRLRRRRNRQRKVLIAGTVKGGPAFVEPEMTSVASCLPQDDVRVQPDPTTELLLREMPSQDIIHLTTHGVFREDNPVFSRLSMSDGALFLADILDATLKADLVVLSACNTGQVFPGKGDDLSGVAHGFLAAGARQLVASLWRVHDEATRALMGEFYRLYVGEAGGDPVAALSSARRAIRKQWSHPFYWGGFSVHGR